jgi:hypothetical protein
MFQMKHGDALWYAPKPYQFLIYFFSYRVRQTQKKNHLFSSGILLKKSQTYNEQQKCRILVKMNVIYLM